MTRIMSGMKLHSTIGHRTRNALTIDRNLMLLGVWVLLVGCLQLVQSTNHAASCDWTGSGLTSYRGGEMREITTVYLRCTGGRVIWKYPRGAIRVVLRPPNAANRTIKACLKMDERANRTTMANVFFETNRRLVPVYDQWNATTNTQIIKCFRSHNSQVTLYIEAEESHVSDQRIMFEYSLEFLNHKNLELAHLHPHKNAAAHQHHSDDDASINTIEHGDMSSVDKHQHRYKTIAMHDEIVNGMGASWEMCRPCSETEMVHAYCSSNIVTRGHIFNVQENEALDTIEIVVKGTKVLRENWSSLLFLEETRYLHKRRKYMRTKHHHRRKDTPFLNGGDDVGDDEDEMRQLTSTTAAPKVPIFKFHTPTHCMASPGDGEFVFIGRQRFADDLVLICAPRLEEWVRIVYRFNETNDAPCILQS